MCEELRVVATGWAVQRMNGSIVTDFRSDASERRIWRIAQLGYSSEEIEIVKARSARAFRCRLIEEGEGT